MIGSARPAWSIACSAAIRWPRNWRSGRRRRKRCRTHRRNMAVHKEHKEFHTLDLGSGWSVPPGYPSGIEHKILAGTLEETEGRGHRTRLLRFAPGVFTTAPFVHE